MTPQTQIREHLVENMNIESFRTTIGFNVLEICSVIELAILCAETELGASANFYRFLTENIAVTSVPTSYLVENMGVESF